MIMLLVLLLL